MTVPLSELLWRGLAAGHDTIWITADGQPVSRAAFRAAVAAARRALRQHGDPRGRRVALHGTVTPALLACLIAGLLDGAVVVPLDADLPDRRKAAMVALAGAGVVFDFAGGAAGFAPGAVIIDATGARAVAAVVGAMPDTATDAVLGAAIDAAPVAATDATVDLALGAAPDAARSAVLGAAIDAVPGAATDATVDLVLGAAPDAAHDAVLGAALDEAPDAATDEAGARALGPASDAARDVVTGASARAAFDEQTAELPAPPTLDDDAACYVFFTSGTTGTPKGVLGRRVGLAHFLAWETTLLGLAPGDRVSLLTRLSFDVVLRDILAPVVAGATGCIAPRGLGPGEMLDWLDAHAITATHVVPSLARGFLSAARPGFAGRALRHTLFAGEPLSGSLVRRWHAAFPGSAIYNLYGPTETTLAKFCARIAPDALAGDDVVPVGHPLPGAEAIILDRSRSPAVPGEIGEVAIATPHRSLGYLDAGQTLERFVGIAGREVYLTGDRGFVAPDGQLHLRGRSDDQVKILGVRIELAGVAAAIQAFDGVGDAAVICVDDGDDRRLIAYVTAPGGAGVVPALRPYLAERLPPAAIPSRFIELAAMPLTAHGKLDRARLPRPDCDDRAPEPAASPAEQVIAEAFAAALRRESVGALDDFFALGGDSLAAAAVCAAILDRLGVHLPPAELLGAATPRALAERVRAGSVAAPIPRAPVQHHFALTPQQRRYFRTFCAGGNRSWCNMVALWPLPDGTSRAALEDALADVLARHDSLRLAFSFDDAGGLRQAIDFRWDPEVAEVDLAALAAPAAAAAIECWRIAEAEQPIPLIGRGPRFRARLLALAGGQRRLLWTVHHLVSDGTSQGIFARELGDALAGRRPGEAERFAQRSFRDVAAWAAERPELAAARDHARALFAAPYHHRYLPEHPVAGDLQRCFALVRALPPVVHGRIRALARGHRTTPYAIVLAAVFRVLARRIGAPDLVILTPLAGREHPQVAPLIGDFINLVALRIADVPERSAAALIEAVKHQVAGAARHQAFQLDELVDELGLGFDPDRNPVSGFSVNYQPQAGAMPALPDTVIDKGYKLKYDVLFVVREYDDATSVEIQFRAGLLDAAGAAALFDELCAATEG